MILQLLDNNLPNNMVTTAQLFLLIVINVTVHVAMLFTSIEQSCFFFSFSQFKRLIHDVTRVEISKIHQICTSIFQWILVSKFDVSSIKSTRFTS